MLLDERKIALTPAYEIANLSEEEQRMLLETIDSEQATPSLSQAQRMRKLSRSGDLNDDTSEIMIHKAAKKAFDDLGIAKLPTFRSLQALKANVDRILEKDADRENRDSDKKAIL